MKKKQPDPTELTRDHVFVALYLDDIEEIDAHIRRYAERRHAEVHFTIDDDLAEYDGGWDEVVKQKGRDLEDLALSWVVHPPVADDDEHVDEDVDIDSVATVFHLSAARDPLFSSMILSCRGHDVESVFKNISRTVSRRTLTSSTRLKSAMQWIWIIGVFPALGLLGDEEVSWRTWSFLALGAALFLFAAGSNYLTPTGFVIARRHERPGFARRNKDKIIWTVIGVALGVVTSFVGALLGVDKIREWLS